MHRDNFTFTSIVPKQDTSNHTNCVQWFDNQNMPTVYTNGTMVPYRLMAEMGLTRTEC